MTNHGIKFSFVIPHKNTPELLQKCLNSIPDRDNIQVIVVDDNSDKKIVDFQNFPHWNGKNYEFYLTKSGKGAGYARNVALKHVQGEWIIFADADDLFKTDNLLSLMECDCDKYDVIAFPTEVTFENGKSQPYQLKYTSLYQGFDYTLIGTRKLFDNNIKDILYRQTESWCKMVKKEHIDRHNIFFEEVPVYNDVIASVMLAINTKDNQIGIFSEIIYNYIRRYGSLSDNNINTKTRYRLLELFKAQKLLLSENKEQYLGNISCYFDSLISESIFTAIHFCLIQMNMVSFREGIKSLKYVCSIRNIRIGLALRTRLHKFLSHIHI